jgi:hypothetical protein
MHHSTAATFLLAATGSFASAQASNEIDNSISVILQNQDIELGSTTEFSEGVRETKQPVGSSGPFTTVGSISAMVLVNRTYAARFSMTTMSPLSFFVVTTTTPLLQMVTVASGISRTVPSWSAPSFATRSSRKES